MTTLAERRARLLEYAPWVLRDYFSNQGPATAIVLLLVGVATVGPAIAMAGAAWEYGRVNPQIAGQLLAVMAERLAFLGAFFATNGIVANDRKLGYYRFLFAKPVDPARYYAMTFVLYGIGLLGVTVLLTLAWGVTVRPAFSLELMLVVALMYVAYGGLGFLLSAAWRFDWLSLVTVLLIANLGWWAWGDATGVRHWVLYLLPPVHRDDAVFAIVDGLGREVPWGSIAWLFGYGLACFALGMLVIRKRPLGTT
jgi:hypothetical protein